MTSPTSTYCKKVISFRPNVIENNTAFECMALIYKYLQKQYGFSFNIVKSNEDRYEDAEFNVISIPNYVWRTFPYTPLFGYSFRRRRLFHSIFDKASLVLTVDPTVYPQGLLAIREASRQNLPVWIDSSITTLNIGQGLWWWLFRNTFRKALKQTTGIFITAPKCIERFRQLRLFDEDIAGNFSVMGHPVDTELFKPQIKKSTEDGKLRIIVVSRLVPEKGLFYILDALTPVLHKNKWILLTLYGEGSMKPLLEKELKIRKLESQISINPVVPHDKLSKVLGSSDIFLNHALSTPRWEEYFGAANLEAMACGLPCIVTRSGAIPYVIRDDKAALIIEERDVIGLRNAIMRLIEDKSSAEQLGYRARRYVEKHYSLPIIAEKYYQIIRQHIGR